MGLNARFEALLGLCADWLQLEGSYCKLYADVAGFVENSLCLLQKYQNKRHWWLAPDLRSMSSSFLVHFVGNLVLCDPCNFLFVINLLWSIKEQFFPTLICVLDVKSSHPSRWSTFKEEKFCSKLERKRSTRAWHLKEEVGNYFEIYTHIY